MLSFHLGLIISATIIPITILYEKSSPSYIVDEYLERLNSNLSTYNTKNRNSHYSLVNLLPFNHYVSKDEYFPLIEFAGSDDLKSRAEALKNVAKNEHLILVASALNNVEDGSRYSTIEKNYSSSLMNFNSSKNSKKDLFGVLQFALDDFIKKFEDFRNNTRTNPSHDEEKISSKNESSIFPGTDTNPKKDTYLKPKQEYKNSNKEDANARVLKNLQLQIKSLMSQISKQKAIEKKPNIFGKNGNDTGIDYPISSRRS